MEVYGVEILLHIFLTSGLEGDEWLASRPNLLIPEIEPTILVTVAVGRIFPRRPYERCERKCDCVGI